MIYLIKIFLLILNLFIYFPCQYLNCGDFIDKRNFRYYSNHIIRDFNIKNKCHLIINLNYQIRILITLYWINLGFYLLIENCYIFSDYYSINNFVSNC